MSDLQCPATILVVRAGREQARALGRSLVDRRLALIYTNPGPQAMQTAEIVAAETGVPVVVQEHADDLFETIADAHRGETVLVVSDDLATSQHLPNGRVVEVAVDADGWSVRNA